jgi:hypothetical protein
MSDGENIHVPLGFIFTVSLCNLLKIAEIIKQLQGVETVMI